MDSIEIIEKVTVIVRECGESTADQCHQILAEYFPPESVFRVREKPFSAALRKSLQLGIKEGKEYILCVDADVIPAPDQIVKMVKELAVSPRHIPELQAMVFDNLFRVLRPAGNHLYRTSLAGKAIDCIPPEGTSLRPESDMLSRLIRKGNPWKQSRLVVGLHDFQQYPQDIYRKAFLHAKKHAEFVDYLTLLWDGLSVDSGEFTLAKSALNDSLEYSDTVFVAKDFLEGQARSRVNALGTKMEPSVIKTNMNDILDAMPNHLHDARRQCEQSIHDRIFKSPGAYVRGFVSSHFFQYLFS